MNQDHENHTSEAAEAPQRRLPARVVSFGLRAATLAGFVTPVAMVLSGLAGEAAQNVADAHFTTCCPL